MVPFCFDSSVEGVFLLPFFSKSSAKFVFQSFSCFGFLIKNFTGLSSFYKRLILKQPHKKKLLMRLDL